jgi:RhtB (resistance to homoserine/threonine) family protein
MDNYLLFLFMSFLLIILPGPDTGLVVQNTITYGKKNGIKTVFGIVSGLVMHTLAVTFGLSAILIQSAVVFSIFKYIGAGYLIYLGFMSFKSLNGALQKNEQSIPKRMNRKTQSCFLQGFLTNVANPKVAVFFLTFLPQFVGSDANHFGQFLLLGMTYILLTILWFLVYIYLIDLLSYWFKKPTVQSALQRVTGFALMGFGIKLALEKQP